MTDTNNVIAARRRSTEFRLVLMAGIITALDNRVKTMNHDVVRIDTIVSNALGLKPDVDRIARADGKNDARRD